MAQTNVQAFSGDVAISSNLEVGTANLFVDTVSGRVGVGMTSPGSTLDVVGDVAISSNLEVGTANLFVDTVSGRVGVGTTNPTASLHVHNGNIRVDKTGECIIENKNDSSDFGTLTLTSGYRGASNRPKIQIDGYKGAGTVNGDNLITFHTNGSERMKINQSGNVGIGTASPGVKLHVSGDTILDGSTYRKRRDWNRNALAYVYLGNVRTQSTTGIRLDVSLNNSNSGYYMYQFQITLTDEDTYHEGGKMIYSGMGVSGESVYRGVELGYVYVGSSGNYEYQLWLKDPTYSVSGPMDAYLNCQGYYNFDTEVSDVAQGGAAPTNFQLGVPGVLVRETGNVGIGTTSPVSKLTVIGKDSTISGAGLYNASYYTGASVMVSENNYNVEDARGGDEHYSTLIVSSDHASDSGNNAAGSIGFAAPNEFGGYSVQYGQISGVRLGNFYGGLSFSTMHNLNDGRLREAMRIANGNVGIGTTSPQARLQVGGNAETGPQYLWIRGHRINEAGEISGIHFYNSLTSGDRGNSRIINSRGTNNYGSNLEFWTNPDDNVPATLRMAILANGNVGIGTTNPLSTLQVGNGTTPTTGDASGSISLFGTGATKSYSGRPGMYHRANVGLGLWSDATISFEVNADSGTPTEAMRIDRNGSVGIGTASPQNLLSLYKNSVNGASINLESSGGYSSGITQKSGGSDDRSLQFQSYPYAGANPAYKFLTWNSTDNGFNDVFNITGDGNVGIGTANPNQGNLTVYALGADPYFSGYVEGDYADATDFTGLAHFKSYGSHGVIRVSNSADYTGTTRIDFNTILSNFWGVNTPSSSYFRGTAPTAGRIMVTGESNNNYEDSYMTFHTCRDLRVDGIGGTGNLYERMRITSTGNVGIGTANPLHKLDVMTSAGGTGLYIRSSNYGANNEATHIRIGAGGSAADAHHAMITGGHTTNGSSYLAFSTIADVATDGYDPAERMRITNVGNVGIGNASPVAKLDVNAGSSYVNIRGPTQGNSGGPNNDPWTGLSLERLGTNGETYNGSVGLRAYRWATSGADPAMALTFNMSSTQPYNTADVMTLRSNGTVGIGSTSPAYNLDVSGISRSTGGVMIGPGYGYTQHKAGRVDVVSGNPNLTLIFLMRKTNNWIPGTIRVFWVRTDVNGGGNAGGAAVYRYQRYTASGIITSLVLGSTTDISITYSTAGSAYDEIQVTVTNGRERLIVDVEVSDVYGFIG